MRPDSVEVLGDDTRTRREGGLHPGPALEPCFHGFSGEQPGRDHHGRIRRVGAARDGRNDDGAVRDAFGRARVADLFRRGFEDFARRRAAFRDEPAEFSAVHGAFHSVEDFIEGLPDSPQRHAVLRPLGSGEARLDPTEIEVQHFAEYGLGVRIRPEQSLLARVAFDPVDERAAARQFQVPQGIRVDREERRGGAEFRRHVRERRAVRDAERAESGPEEFDELADHSVRPQHLGQHQDEVGRRRAGRERAPGPDAEHDGFRQEHRLAEHRRFGFDAADAPSEHAESVDHRRVRIRPDQRVGVQPAVTRQDDLPQVLEIDLVADPHARWHHAETFERLLRPVEQGVTLAIPAIFPAQVGGIRVGAAVTIDLDRMVDDKVHGNERIHAPGIGTRPRDRTSKRREIDDRRDTRKVLHQHARRHEGDRRGAAIRPSGERRDVRLRDVPATRPPGDVFQEDLDGVRKPRRVRAGPRAQLREADIGNRSRHRPRASP